MMVTVIMIFWPFSGFWLWISLRDFENNLLAKAEDLQMRNLQIPQEVMGNIECFKISGSVKSNQLTFELCFAPMCHKWNLLKPVCGIMK